MQLSVAHEEEGKDEFQSLGDIRCERCCFDEAAQGVRLRSISFNGVCKQRKEFFFLV